MRLVGVAFLLGACQSVVWGLALKSDPAHETTEFTYAHCDDLYDNSRLPCEERWVTVAPACTGQSQSPINIVTDDVSASKAEPPKLAAGTCPRVELVDAMKNGHTWEVLADSVCSQPIPVSQFRGGSVATVEGVDYFFQQFHFHAPSEHTINGKHFDAECHLVHKSADGNLLVIGVLFNAQGTKDNEFLEQFWSKGFEGATLEEGVSPYKGLLSHTESYYHYVGSTTSPPCIANVNWFLVAEPEEMSVAQLNKYRTALLNLPQTKQAGRNNRPVQPIGSRTVIKLAVAAPEPEKAPEVQQPQQGYPFQFQPPLINYPAPFTYHGHMPQAMDPHLMYWYFMHLYLNPSRVWGPLYPGFY